MPQRLAEKFGIKQADDSLVPQRRVQIGAHGDIEFEVAVAYSASSDSFAAHAYVLNAQRQKTRLGVEPLYADDERSAFIRAWTLIDLWLSK